MKLYQEKISSDTR